MGLEQKVGEAFVKLEVREKDVQEMRSYLACMKKHDRDNYRHCLRVGLLGIEAANHLRLDAKALLYAGLLHDLGKTLIPPILLHDYKKKNKFLIDYHPLDSYDIIKRSFSFTAEIVLRHHHYQPEAYPRVLPPYGKKFSEKTIHKIEELSQTLAIVDTYDSAMTRANNKFVHGKPRTLSREETKRLLLDYYPKFSAQIDSLFEHRVL